MQSSPEDTQRTRYESWFEPHRFGTIKSSFCSQPSWSTPPQPKRHDYLSHSDHVSYSFPLAPPKKMKQKTYIHWIIPLPTRSPSGVGQSWSHKANTVWAVPACFSIFKMGRLLLSEHLSCYCKSSVTLRSSSPNTTVLIKPSRLILPGSLMTRLPGKR